MVVAGCLNALLERVHREHVPGGRIVSRREQRGQVDVSALGDYDTFHHDLFAGAGLHAYALGMQLESRCRRQQCCIDEGRFPGARVPVEHHAAVHGDEAGKLGRLLLAREEDGVIGIAKRCDAPERTVWYGNAGLAYAGYGRNSFPSTASYSLGTNDHTSCTMNFTYRSCLSQTSTSSGSGL